jgi:hypothetical protein
MTCAERFNKLLSSDWSRLPNLFFLGLIFILSRIPLLNLGFGLDADAWRVANTAFDLKHHSQYHASRFPGYPVPEYVNSLLIDHGWLATNSLTMLLTLISVFVFARILKILDYRNRGLLIITYAFLPILWINSANTMDYMWSLCFIMLTWFFILRTRWIVAGFMMALAIGSRLPTLILALPFGYMCYSEERDIRSSMKFLLSATVFTILFYTPLFLTYGLGFVQSYPTETGLLQIGYLAIKHFGLLPIIVSIALLVLSHRQLHRLIARHDRHIISALLAVLVGLVVFAAMPYHIEYVIPFIPFILLLIYRAGVQHIESGRIRTSLFERGTIINNLKARKQQLEFAQRLIESPVQAHSTVIIGPWLPILAHLDEKVSSVRETKRMYDPNQPREGVRNFDRAISYRYLLTLPELQQLIQEDNTIYYIDGIKEFTIEVYGYDLADYQTVYVKI